ncbi:unnamed protein product, partial [Amoebophrya sp. A25]
PRRRNTIRTLLTCHGKSKERRNRNTYYQVCRPKVCENYFAKFSESNFWFPIHDHQEGQLLERGMSSPSRRTRHPLYRFEPPADKHYLGSRGDDRDDENETEGGKAGERELSSSRGSRGIISSEPTTGARSSRVKTASPGRGPTSSGTTARRGAGHQTVVTRSRENSADTRADVDITTVDDRSGAPLRLPSTSSGTVIGSRSSSQNAAGGRRNPLSPTAPLAKRKMDAHQQHSPDVLNVKNVTSTQQHASSASGGGGCGGEGGGGNSSSSRIVSRTSNLIEDMFSGSESDDEGNDNQNDSSEDVDEPVVPATATRTGTSLPQLLSGRTIVQVASTFEQGGGVEDEHLRLKSIVPSSPPPPRPMSGRITRGSASRGPQGDFLDADVNMSPRE